jgi:hypothetical protein
VTTYKTNITGTTPFADYQFKVRATNQQGVGEWSMMSAAAQFNYNDGDGGSSYVEYDLDGKHWKGMKFENSGTFNVKVNAKDWRILVIGGGGSGNGGNNAAGGEVKQVAVPTNLINESQLTVTVAGASGTSRVALKSSNFELASARGNCCGNGNTTWFNGTSRCFGGSGGKVWWNHCCPANGDAPGCCGGSWDCNGGAQGKCYGGGGGGVQHTQTCNQAGYKGHVIILWEVPV